MTLSVHEIFTPNDAPTHTYVERDKSKLELQLKQLYETPKVIVSVSGPSKSGKTVLIKKVISDDALIPVVGTGIMSVENLWERVLQWMEVPRPISSTQSMSGGVSAGISAGGEAGIALLAKGKIGGTINATGNQSLSQTASVSQDALIQVINEVANSDFVVFIDDFHYIKEGLRSEIGRQIKVASEKGVKFLIASVPHRSDDVVRSNTELRGRVGALDVDYWESLELAKIARQGFSALNCDISKSIEDRMIQESFGSPQLMQCICLNLCHVLNISKPLEEERRLNINISDLDEALRRTSAFTDFTKLVTALQTGPKSRGTERKVHTFTDGSKGDVYRAILLALQSDPGNLSFTYENISQRIRQVCVDDAPVGSSINSALEKISEIGDQLQPNNSPISWDGDNLDIVDPYLLFYIRCSTKIKEIRP